MEKFEDQDEAMDVLMSKLEELPDEKLGLFFVNLFGADGLMEMAQDIIESRGYVFNTEKDVQGFINSMLS